MSKSEQGAFSIKYDSHFLRRRWMIARSLVEDFNWNHVSCWTYLVTNNQQPFLPFDGAMMRIIRFFSQLKRICAISKEILNSRRDCLSKKNIYIKTKTYKKNIKYKISLESILSHGFDPLMSNDIYCSVSHGNG